MDYLSEFHWWYVPVGIFVLFLLFGKSKGGVVRERYTAILEILDQRFTGCRQEAKYSVFKKDSPDHIEIELEALTIPVGDELEFLLNDQLFARVKVERDKEAEFDHWSDEGIDFPVIQDGDQLLIRYQNSDALKGVFRRQT